MGLVFDVGRRDGASTYAFEARENIGEHGVFEFSSFFNVTSVEQALDSLLADQFSNIGWNWNADVPTVTAASWVFLALPIGRPKGFDLLFAEITG